MQKNLDNLDKKTISIVIPTYNEEDNVYYAYEMLNQLFSEELPDYSMKIIFADVGVAVIAILNAMRAMK